MEVRSATSADVDAILALWVRADTEPTPTDDAPGIEQLLARSPDALVVATDGDTIVGSIMVGWDGWRGSMYRLGVLPEHRRRGIGRALVEAGHARLRALGAVRAGLQLADGEEATDLQIWYTTQLLEGIEGASAPE